MRIKERYEQLVSDCKRWVRNVKNPKRSCMFFFKKGDLNHRAYYLYDVWERVKAADSCGHDVIVTADDDGLRLVYSQRPGNPPFEINTF